MKKTLALVLALIMLFSLCACGGDTGTTPPDDDSGSGNVTTTPDGGSGDSTSADPNADKYGGVLVTARSVNPTSLFYPYMYASSQKYCFPAVETLGRMNLDTFLYEPFLCDSWEEDREAQTLTLKIKQGIKFHDGSDLNADSVAWNFTFMMENGNGGQIGNPTEVTIEDEYTVKLTYGEGMALTIIEQVAATPIYSKVAYETNGLDWCLNNIVGTGPFVFEEYEPDSYMTFVRNENYWQEGLPYLDGVRHQIIPEWSALMSAFVNEDIDWFVCGDMTTMDSLEAMGIENKALVLPDSGTTFGIYPNSMIEGDPLYDVEVRKAIMLYGVDWDLVTFAAKGKYGFTSIQGITEGALGYSAELENESYYDPDKAMQMLADAGYPNGFSTKIYSANYGIPAATALQAELAKIGITAEVEQIQTSDGRRYDGTTPGFWINSGYTAVDFGNSLLRQYSGYGQMNRMMNFSDEYQAVVDKVQNAATEAESAQYIGEAIRKLSVDECLYRVMFIQNNVCYLQDDVVDSGLESNNYYTPEIAYIKK